MQVATLVGQTCNLSKKPQLLAKSTTNACSAIWWPKLELMQVKIEIEEKVEKKFRKKFKKKVEKIARGTTDLGN